MAYTPQFQKEYENGWVDFPSEETLVTAHALDGYDKALEHIEEYLSDYPIAQTGTMPTASEDELGNIYQYIGETTATFTQGYFYKCVSDEEEEPTYSWQTINVQSGGGGGTNVVANPVGEPTDDLETIQIGEIVYDIPGGGGNTDSWTGTQAEYEAQASQIEDGTQVNITDDEERVEAFHTYSTNEKVVGEWIDGKPIYEKTIDCGNLPDNTTKAVAHGISDLDIITNWSGTCYSTVNSGYSRPMPLSDPTATNTIRIDVSGGNVNIKTGTDWSTYKGYVTLEYTKTTD